MRELDRGAVSIYGIDEILLMENAGESTYFVIANEMGGVCGKKYVVLCGAGNNGGDGCVVARKLHSGGGRVKVILLADPAKFSGIARKNLEIVEKLSIEIITHSAAAEVARHIAESDAVVDAIFGTGLTREVGGIYADVVRLVNAGNAPVFCVDIPSGIAGDTGKIMGVAIKGTCTVTYGLPKIGAMLYPGYEYCGKLFVSHISFPPCHYDGDHIKCAVNDPPALPQRVASGHKGDFGKALFIAGAAAYYGAPYLSSLAFLRAGGGYARLATPKSLAPCIAGRGYEIVFLPQEETAAGSIARGNADALLEQADQSDFVVIGPGLSLAEDTQKLVRELVPLINTPLLLDGDGITAVCRDLEIIKKRKAPTILTPHLGEMSRITGIPAKEIDERKVDVLQQSTDALQSIIVLKGAHSLIGMPDGRVYVNLSGNSGMATAGSGDVLTGAIAAMFGLGLNVEDAAKKGVFIHGCAGDLAATVLGQDGMTAQDILDYLPRAVKGDREGFDETQCRRYKGPIVV